jgi:predicted RNA-binding Zn ribbon-like protein
MTHPDEHTVPELFELSGGALCLDFANTWGNQLDPASDRLQDYGRLLAFARQAGYLNGGPFAALSGAAGGNATGAIAAFSLACELRCVVYRIFSSQAGSREISREDVDRINALLGEALSHRRLAKRDGGFAWSWDVADVNDLRAPIWPVIESAATLLTSGDFNRVRECGAEDCNWLFLDRSRAGTRRWCSMSSCGNRAKARRYYHRQQKS